MYKMQETVCWRNGECAPHTNERLPSDIKHRRLEKPVANHFNSKGHSLEDLSIIVIKQINREEANIRRVKESYWIQTLRSLTSEGLNLDP